MFTYLLAHLVKLWPVDKQEKRDENFKTSLQDNNQ